MIKLVLLRHGESHWNRENRFSGWADVDLSANGIQEAENAGTLLKQEGYCFDMAYTSFLKRAIRTLWIVQDIMDLMWMPVVKTWRLNERHYGALQGFNKAETANKFGEEQVLAWRRSHDTRPPLVDTTDERYPGNEIRYQRLDQKRWPRGECLKDTVDRFMPFWTKIIAPSLSRGKRLIITAHGNTLRAMAAVADQGKTT